MSSAFSVFKRSRGLHARNARQRANSRRLVLEQLDPRLVLSASPFGAMQQDTGEYLLGSSTATVVLMESTGSASSEDWTVDSINAVKAKIDEALQWWQDTLVAQSSVHRLNFVTDYQYADNPVPTTVEPIAEKSNVYTTWVNHFLDHANVNTSDGISADVRKFNHSQRLHHGTDWGFTIFVVNDENDADGMFSEGGSFRRAFAFAGGRYMIVPANRPASSFAHEMGHMFWARDEYPGGGSYTDRRGYYNAQNINAHDNPTEGFIQQQSLMASGSLMAQAYANHQTSNSSMAMLGWVDSDGDGVFDVLDVPHTLVGSGEQVGDSYLFQATASVNTMANRNSSGFQSDITLNKIDVVEYRFDDGDWIVAATPGTPQAEIQFAAAVPDGASHIEIRSRSQDAVSQQTIASSPLFIAPVDAKTLNAVNGLAGIVWADSNGNDQWDVGESGLEGVELRLVDTAGQPIELRSQYDSDPFANDVALNNEFADIQIAAVGTHILNSSVYSREYAQASTGDRVFANFNAATNSVVKTWGAESRTLRITFDSPQTTVSIDAIADDHGDVARLEAYNTQGNLLQRITSDLLAAGETAELTVTQMSGDISYVIARAHYNTEVLFDNLQVGPKSSVETDAQGDFRFEALPGGDYRVEALPASGRQLGTPAIVDRTINNFLPVTDLVFGMDLPAWLNPAVAEDVTDDAVVTPLDALVIINDLNSNGARELPQPTGGNVPPPYLDTSGDGWVTSIDALRVINLLNEGASAEGESRLEGIDWRQPSIPDRGNEQEDTVELATIDSQVDSLESEADYRYHCPPQDLVLELWFGDNSQPNNGEQEVVEPSVGALGLERGHGEIEQP